MPSKRPRHSAERPAPLAFADVKPILSRLERIADSVVLVGGQAVNFWAEVYAPRVPAIDSGAPSGPLFRIMHPSRSWRAAFTTP